MIGKKKYHDYFKLYNEINEKKQLEFIPMFFAIITFASFFSIFKDANSIILFIILLFTTTIIAALITKKTNKNVNNLDEEYERIIKNDFIFKRIHLTSITTLSKNEKKLEAALEQNYESVELVEKESKSQEKALNNILKQFHKKLYEKTIYDFNITGVINNKKVRIIRVNNYRTIRGDDPESTSHISAFNGYIIQIYGCNNPKITRLNNEYIYDKEKEELTFLVSDQVKSNMLIHFDNRYKSNLFNKSSNLELFNRNYNFYNELFNLIELISS